MPPYRRKPASSKLYWNHRERMADRGKTEIKNISSFSTYDKNGWPGSIALKGNVRVFVQKLITTGPRQSFDELSLTGMKFSIPVKLNLIDEYRFFQID